MSSPTQQSPSANGLADSPRRLSRQARISIGLAALFIVGATVAGCGSSTPDSGGSVAGSAATAGTGSGTAGTGGTTTGATFTQVLALFGPSGHNCGVCHASSPSTVNGGLQFNTAMPAQAYSALVGKSSAGVSGSKCAGKAFVVAGNPTGSLLYDKVANATPSCGVQMPMGGVPLTAAEVATVSAWITAGAKNN